MRGVVSQEFDAELAAMLIEGLLSFVEQEVVPLERANADALADARQVYLPTGGKAPWLVDLELEVRQRSAEAGYFACTVPTELGGGGQGPTVYFLLWEALYHHCGAGRILPFEALAHFATGPSSVLVEARDEAVVADLLAGRRSMCFGLSEPDSGSDAWGMKTSAVADGDAWRITGTKQWTTNGPSADVCLVFAITDARRAKLRQGGVSAFLVPTKTPGFSVDSVITLFGHIGGDEAILSFEDVRVPGTALVGELDSGFELALKAVNEGRLYNCGRAIGLARWCLDQAVDYAKQRRTFDRPISDYQAIQWHLADSATELYAARCMTLDCARRLERGERAIKELSMSKLMATEAGCRAIDRCTQVLGAMGLTSEMRFYDAWQQVRTVRIAEGSGEILRRTIAGRMLQGDLSL